MIQKKNETTIQRKKPLIKTLLPASLAVLLLSALLVSAGAAATDLSTITFDDAYFAVQHAADSKSSDTGYTVTSDLTIDGKGRTLVLTSGSDTSVDYVGWFGYLTINSGKTLTIKNLTITTTGTGITNGHNCVGLIAGYLTGGGTLKLENVTVNYATITASGYFVGGLVGHAAGSARVNAHECKVQHCSLRSSSGSDVGGLVGLAYSASQTFEACSVANCTISANGYYVGGLVGAAEYESVNAHECNVANCTISASVHDVGGLVGLADSASQTFEACNVANCVIASASGNNVGGLVGLAHSASIAYGAGNTVAGCAIHGSDYVNAVQGNPFVSTAVTVSNSINATSGFTFYSSSGGEITDINTIYNTVHHADYNSGTITTVGTYGAQSGYGDISKYVVSFLIGDDTTGAVPSMQVVKNSGTESVTLPGSDGFSNSHKSFGGWKVGTTSEILQPGVSYTPTADVVMTAVWNVVTQITLDANGGSGAAPASVNATYDSADLSSAIINPVLAGHTFYGWNMSKSASPSLIGTDGKLISGITGYTEGGVWSNATAKTLTVYANLSANVTHVTFENKSGDTFLRDFTYNADIGTIPTPSKTGHTFYGWNLSAADGTPVLTAAGQFIGTSYGTGTKWTNAAYADGAGMTLVANTTAITYTVTFNNTTGSGIMDNQQFTYDEPQNLNHSTFTAPSGKQFAGWNKTDASGTTVDFTDSASVLNLCSGEGDVITLYAVWTNIPSKPTPQPTYGATRFYSSGGSSGDTGSGHYAEYPRQLSGSTSASFGSSPVATAVGFSAPVSGEITVSYTTDTISDKVRADVDADGTGRTGGIKNAPYLVTAQTNDYGYEFYEVFRVEGSAKTDLSKVCEISFRIPLNALSRQGFTQNDVILYHGNAEGTEWEPLNTCLVSTDKVYAYYSAETSGASPFAVVFMEDMTIVPAEENSPSSAPAAEKTPVHTSVPAPVQTAEQNPAETPKSPVPASGILAGFAAAGLLSGFRLSRR